MYFILGQAGCYFPLEFQGEFLTQSMVTREIAYTSVSILFDSIPSWGQCHRRLGKHIILSSGSGSGSCFKCLSIVARSQNVLQLHANDLNSCHSTEESAIQSCPTPQDVRERKATEMMFYKTKSFYGGSAITRTYCPLNGNYKFTYSINEGTEDDLECNQPISMAGDCPSGYKFDLHFKGCSFPDFGKTTFNSKKTRFLKPNFSSNRYELSMFGFMGWRQRRNLYEFVRHQTAAVGRRSKAQIQMCSK